MLGNLRSGHTTSCGCLRRDAGFLGKRRSNKDQAGKYAEPIMPLDPIIYALRKRRYDLNVTQAQLAKRMGWDKRTVQTAESGRVAVSFAFVVAWAQSLGMSIKLEG